MTRSPLPIDFYLRSAAEVAKDLLGKGLLVVRGKESLLVEIVEAEAYHREDPASHSYGGPTPRNASMFAGGGTCYVYQLRGHYCMNVVTGAPGAGEAVLLRAASPLEGKARMLENRCRPLRNGSQGSVRRETLLLAGPGRLTQALDIDLSHDGRRFDETDFRLVDLGNPAPARIIRTTRIGITKAAQERLRFYVAGSPWISRK